jgi:hypothetical protein
MNKAFGDKPTASDPCANSYNTALETNLEVYESIYINQEMCSNNCPCAPTLKQTDWMTLNRDEVGRCRVWDFTGTITSYEECLKSPGATATLGFKAFADGLMKDSSWSMIAGLMKFLESAYSCAGVCEPALFSYSRSIENGRPS